MLLLEMILIVDDSVWSGVGAVGDGGCWKLVVG